MSRSYRKTPILPVTGARSEKAFKVAAHRAERRAAAQRLGQGLDPLPSRLFGDPWAGPKDGRRWDAGLAPRWTRK